MLVVAPEGQERERGPVMGWQEEQDRREAELAAAVEWLREHGEDAEFTERTIRTHLRRSDARNRGEDPYTGKQLQPYPGGIAVRNGEEWFSELGMKARSKRRVGRRCLQCNSIVTIKGDYAVCETHGVVKQASAAE